MDKEGYDAIVSAHDWMFIDPIPVEDQDIRFVNIRELGNKGIHLPTDILNSLTESGFMKRRPTNSGPMEGGPRFVVTAIVGNEVILEDLNSSAA